MSFCCCSRNIHCFHHFSWKIRCWIASMWFVWISSLQRHWYISQYLEAIAALWNTSSNSILTQVDLNIRSYCLRCCNFTGWRSVVVRDKLQGIALPWWSKAHFKSYTMSELKILQIIGLSQTPVSAVLKSVRILSISQKDNSCIQIKKVYCAYRSSNPGSFKHLCCWTFLSPFSSGIPKVTSECISICTDICFCWIKMTLCTTSAFNDITNSENCYKHATYLVYLGLVEITLSCKWNAEIIWVTLSI